MRHRFLKEPLALLHRIRSAAAARAQTKRRAAAVQDVLRDLQSLVSDQIPSLQDAAAVQDVLDLIEKKPLGVLDSLDECCRFPSATGTTFAEKLYGNPDVMNHKRFTKPKRSNTAFIIDHYAGDVEYQVDHFLDKNKDFVVKEHQDLLAASSVPLIAGARLLLLTALLMVLVDRARS